MAPKLFARDIAAYSDAELDHYLKEAGRIIDIEDPENLPEHFIQRLRDRVPGTDNTEQSLPIDLDQVTARLLEVHAGRDTSSRSSSRSSTLPPLSDEEQYQQDLDFQAESYQALVDDGGRPSHPLSLGSGIVENPGEYHKILSFWQSRSDQWMVFGAQLRRWQGFRAYQRSVRKQDRFSVHVQVSKERLVNHGFSQAFQFDENPRRQDQLTTWIEYLSYEVKMYNDDNKFLKRHQTQYENAWKTLVNSNVLRPFETEEFIYSAEYAVQNENDRREAHAAVEHARSAVLLAEKAVYRQRCSRLSSEEPQQQLLAAQSELDTAIQRHATVQRRDYLVAIFCQGTREYHAVQDQTERHKILLWWIRQQIASIESEMDMHWVTTKSSAVRKRKITLQDSIDNKSNQEQVSKRPKRDTEKNQATLGRRISAISTSQGGDKPKHICSATNHDEGTKKWRKEHVQISTETNPTKAVPVRKTSVGGPRNHESGVGAERKGRAVKNALEASCLRHQVRSYTQFREQSSKPPQPLRRSARIVERERQVETPVKAPRRETAHQAQAPTPPSSTESKGRIARSMAASKAVRSRLKAGSRSGAAKPQGISKRKGRIRP